MPVAQIVNCATVKLRKEEIMGHTATRQVKKTKCPSCGAVIHFRHDKNRVGTCPECGDWLIQRSWLTRRLEVLDDGIEGHAFEESDEWIRRVTDEIE